MLLNNQWVTEDIRGNKKKNLDTNKNESTPIQNLRYAAKAVLRGKFIVTQSYPKKQNSLK